MQPIKEGDTICTCGGHGEAVKVRHPRGSKYEYQSFTGVIYQAVGRKKDGKVTWRRAGSFGPVCKGPATEGFLQRLKEIAPHPWVDNVRQNNPVPNLENLIAELPSFDLSWPER